MGRRRYGKKKSKLTTLLVILASSLLVAVVLAGMAKSYWVFDLFSHFVVHYTIASVFFMFCFLYLQRFGWVAIVFLIFVSQVYQLVPLFEEKEKSAGHYDSIKVLQYNVNRSNLNVDEMTRWIVSKSEDVDIVVLSEITESWEESMRRIKWAYPYHISKDMRGGRRMVIFSRLYVDELEIKYLGKEEFPAIVIRGETTGYEQPFVIYGAHPPPPILSSYAKRRNEILESIGNNIAKETIVHKMVIADLNTTRFSPYFKNLIKISGLHDSNEGLKFDALHSTWPNAFSKFMGITIDNVLVSSSIEVEKREVGPSMGSDHFPVITTLKFMVPEKAGNS